MTSPAPMADLSATKTVRLRNAPSWLPEKFRRRSGRISITVSPSAAERRVYRHKKVVPPSVWAPKNRVVTYGPLEGSLWDNDFMPHMRGIMDASFYPSVRYIGNCKTPQGGSSSGAETILGYIADMQPGPAFVVYPDRNTGVKRFKDYLQPMFKKTRVLRRLLTGLSEDLSAMRIKLSNMLIYLGWAGSVASLGNISARYLIGDEVDKWKEQSSKKEANTLSLFYERFRSYIYGGKCWLISTPTTVLGPIWLYLTTEAQVVFDYWIPCHDCGEIHKVVFANIDFAGERDPKKIEEEDLARYVFPCCGLVVNDRGRARALCAGHWRERLTDEEEAAGKVGRELFKCLKALNPSKICFHSPGWISPLVKNSEIAAAFLRGLSDPAAMHYYDNQIAAVAHTPHRQNRKVDAVLKLRDTRPAGQVPGGNVVAGLVAGVDTQTNSHVYAIRAFGWGIKQESWLIRHGEVDTLAALTQVLFEDLYQDADGLYYPVLLAVLDTGGDRTSEMYDYARLHPTRIAAYKGASGRKPRPHSKTVIDTYPNSTVKIPGGLDLYICDTHHYKDQLAAKMRISHDDPGAWHLHADTTESYCGELCVEYCNDKRLWVCPDNTANHGWDCEVMALVGADLLQLRYSQPDNPHGN